MAAANPYAAPAAALGQEPHAHVSKAVLLLLTFFFGGLGAHKFYLGKWWQGALYVLFFWTLVPALVALVEFVVYCFTSEARLNEKYAAHGVAALVFVVAALVFGVALIGLLAAIAIPAYQDYTLRARSAGAIAATSPWRVAVAEHYAEHKQLPNGVAELDPGLVPQDPGDRHSRLVLGADGTLTITFLPSAGRMAGKTIVFRPQAEAGRILWDCAAGTLEPRYRPASCRPRR